MPTVYILFLHVYVSGVHMLTCVCVCAHMRAHGRKHAYVGPKLKWAVLLNCSLPYLLRQGLSIKFRAHQFDTSNPLIGLHLHPKCWDYRHLAMPTAFHRGAKDLNSSPYV